MFVVLYLELQKSRNLVDKFNYNRWIVTKGEIKEALVNKIPMYLLQITKNRKFIYSNTGNEFETTIFQFVSAGIELNRNRYFNLL